MEVVHPKGTSAPPIPEVPFLGYHYFDQKFDDFASNLRNENGGNVILKSSASKLEFVGGFRWTTVQLGFLQALLYLGLLTDVFHGFETPYTSDRFIYERGNQRFVRSSLSLQLLQDWSNRERSEKRRQHVQKVIDICAALAMEYLDPDKFRLPDSPVRPGTPDIDTIRKVQTSIVVLGSFMKSWFSGLYHRHGSREQWSWPPGLLVREKLEKPCPYNWKRLVATNQEHVTYYLSQLSWRPDTKDHRQCTEQKCNAYQVNDKTKYNMKDTCAERCRTVGPDMTKIKAILREGGIPVVKLANDMDMDKDNPTLAVARADEKEPFVAISHVWSDGLGNPDGNVIHRCEFKRLGDRIRSIEPEVKAIWLDTFCVPVGNTDEDKAQRRAAILKMRETYQQARRVLVLDSSLEYENLGNANYRRELEKMRDAAGSLANTIRARATSASTAPDNEQPRITREGTMSLMLALSMSASGMPPIEDVIMQPFLNALPVDMKRIASLFEEDKNIAALECLKEAAARISNSGWMRRLWTFQEGRLAETLTFQFSDGVIDFDTIHYILLFSWIRGRLSHDLILRSIDGSLISLNHDISEAKLGARFERVKAHPGSTAHDTHHRLILNSLAWRSTSRAEDEAICVSHLFGVPIGEFIPAHETAEDRQDRMRRLLLKMGKVPISLLFSGTDIERLSRPGFSWCPRSFLSSQHWFGSTRTVDLVPCTEAGLQVRLTGWKISHAPNFVAQKGGFRFLLQDLKRRRERGKANVYAVFAEAEIDQPGPFAILVDFENVEEVEEEARNIGVCVSCDGDRMRYMWRVVVYVEKNPRSSPVRAETFHERQEFCII